MARILITSGPTREYLDPVRYLSNASSGQMGSALATAAIDAGHQVAVVSGPVDLQYPATAEVISVVSTEEMLAACRKAFPSCNGLIAAAAPCDYRPITVASQKIRKTGEPLRLELVETPDVVARLSAERRSQWLVAFALETEQLRARALEKLIHKNCDLIVVNGPESLHAASTRLAILGKDGRTARHLLRQQSDAARKILEVIQRHLVQRDRA